MLSELIPVTERSDFGANMVAYGEIFGLAAYGEIQWWQLTFQPAGEDVLICAYYQSNDLYSISTLDGLQYMTVLPRHYQQ